MDRHLFLDRSLHSFETDAKLIFQQFADSPHATIAQVIDIVSLINRTLLVIDGVPAHLQNVSDDFKKVARLKQRIFDPIHFRLAHLDVEFQAADARKIEFARIKKHAFQKPISSLHRRWIAGTHLPINLEQRVDWFCDCVFLEGLSDDDTDIVAFRKKDREVLHSSLNNLLKLRRSNLVISFDDDFARFRIDNIGSGVGALELG